jgi:UDP-N-acetylmuramate--alanine ligase
VIEPPWAGRRLHLIGAGGAGMSGLALVAAELGAEVTGSDRADSPYLARLRDAGLSPVVGHDAANVPPGAEVVVSTAIGGENPEVSAARDLGARLLHRGELLAEIAGLKRTVAVSGTHGKTTTTGMAAQILLHAGREPAYVIGGELRSTGRNAAWGGGDWAVVEADESDRSFLSLAPEVAVVTNVELDHHATYRSRLELEEAFRAFVAPARYVVRWTEAAAPAAAGASEITYGIGAGALSAESVRPERAGTAFRVEGVEVQLAVPGDHNVLNALAALAACRLAGVELAEGAAALAGFTGAARRFERRGWTAGGAEVVDDYAHHPTEVRATLEAARGQASGRLVACFQPHLYSRTQHLARDFGRALALADLVVVCDVYPARERAEDHPGVSGLTVARTTAEAAGGRPVYWVPELADAATLLGGELGEGDLLVTLGAGDVDRVATALAGDRAASPGPPG